MVEGLQEPLTDLCVVDLDGTLLRGNSMKRFMRWLPAALWKRRAPLEAAAALWWSGLRAARLVSHRRMKWHLGVIGNRSLRGADWKRFAEHELIPMVNPAVAGHIDALRKSGAKVCLASAAMEPYVEPLRDLLRYEHQLSTPHSETFESYIEMRGQRKLDAIRDLLTSGGYNLTRFLTDHADDMPTAAAYPTRTILVNPSPASLQRFTAAGITRILR